MKRSGFSELIYQYVPKTSHIYIIKNMAQNTENMHFIYICIVTN